VDRTQLDADVSAFSALFITGSLDAQMRDDSSEVATEGLHRPWFVAVVIAPSSPVGEQTSDRDLVTNAYLATVPHVRGDR